MRIRGRGFALMLVLIAVAALFALSMQAAVTARAARAETMALHDEARHLPGARAAAAMVIQGMSMPATESVNTGGFDGGLGGPGGGDNPEEEPEDDIDLGFVLEAMPAAEREKFLRELEEAKKKRDPQVDSLGDGGGFPGGVRGGSSLKMIEKFGVPGETIEVGVRGEVYRVRVRDAGGLLNVNSADERRLEVYFSACGASGSDARRVAQQIVDWRDADDFVRELGAEKAEYKRRGVRPRNGSIVSLEELLFLPSMTGELFERARGGLCLSGDGKVHAGSAPREVLMTVPGMSGQAADRIIAARSQGVITASSLAALLPVGGEAGSFIRAEPTNVFAIEVECVGDASVRFEGVAVVGERGVEQLGLKAR